MKNLIYLLNKNFSCFNQVVRIFDDKIYISNPDDDYIRKTLTVEKLFNGYRLTSDIEYPHDVFVTEVIMAGASLNLVYEEIRRFINRMGL